MTYATYFLKPFLFNIFFAKEEKPITLLELVSD